MSYTQICYHIIFSTKNREPLLVADERKRVYGYLWGVLKAKKCHLYRMGGVADHVHLLAHVHPTVALAGLIRDLKANSTTWIRDQGIIPRFPGWQAEYAAFSKSYADRDTVVEYIKAQEAHHARVSFVDEMKTLLRKEGVAYDERYLQ